MTAAPQRQDTTQLASVAHTFADLGSGATAGRLPNGQLFLQQGPINLVVGIEAETSVCKRAEEGLLQDFPNWLPQLVKVLPRLRTREQSGLERPGGALAQAMVSAVTPFQSTFITPMAAVTGTIADAAVSQIADVPGIRRAWVNNGGDIALHLGTDATFRVGIVSAASKAHIGGEVVIDATMPVRGVATSGWRGRSWSLGVADAVTVLANTAARADAAATVIASATNVEHAAIERKPARELDDDTDLGMRLVTTHVGALDETTCQRALAAGQAAAQRALDNGHIEAVALCVQGHWATLGTAMPGQMQQQLRQQTQRQNTLRKPS